MSEQGLTPDDLVQLSQDQTAYCIYAAALALVVYDALLSFTQEIRCIWKRKLSVVTVLYLFIRYGTVLDMFLQLLDRDYVPQTIPECKAISVTSYLIDILCKVSFAAFECLRIWGITQHQWLPLGLVFVLSMFDPAVNIYNYTRPASDTLTISGPFAGCSKFSTVQMYIYLGVITRAVSIGADAAALLFTLSATQGIFKANSEARAQKTLTSTLFYNGSAQFGMLLLLNVLNIVLAIYSFANTAPGHNQYSTNFTYIQEGLTSILLSRFIMDLRSIYPSESNPSYTSDKSATLQFAVNAEGNLAASLEASWVTGEELDVEEQEEIQYSDNPLATGLLGQDVESVKGDVENIQVVKGSIEVGKIM